MARRGKTNKAKPRQVSVTGETYRRLRGASEEIGSFVDDLVVEALDDPALAREIVGRIRGGN